MDQLLFIGYELSTTFIPFFLAFIGFRSRDKHRGITPSRSRDVLTIVFALYIFAVFHVTGAGTLYDGLLYRLEFRPEEIHFLPFSNGVDITAYLNIFLFIPFGLLVPFIWTHMDHPGTILCSGFAFSMLIELTQLLNRRCTDIDDLLLNTLGALIGYAALKTIMQTAKCHPNFRRTPSNWRLLIYITVIFLGRFLLFNDMGLAKLLYGF